MPSKFLPCSDTITYTAKYPLHGQIRSEYSKAEYRREAKYLIGVSLDPLLLAIFKFWFHEILFYSTNYNEIFVVKKNITAELCNFTKSLLQLI